MIVSLLKRGRGKERLHLDYTTVTEVVVSLSAAQCTVLAVAGLVVQQLGFDVVLMDSKCYPLLDSEGTSGLGFWKSTRKILAVSRSLYEMLTGLSSNDEIIDKAAIDLTADDGPGPSKRKRLEGYDDVDTDTAEKIARMDKRLSFIDELAQSFQWASRLSQKSQLYYPVASGWLAATLVLSTGLMVIPDVPCVVYICHRACAREIQTERV